MSAGAIQDRGHGDLDERVGRHRPACRAGVVQLVTRRRGRRGRDDRGAPSCAACSAAGPRLTPRGRVEQRVPALVRRGRVLRRGDGGEREAR